MNLSIVPYTPDQRGVVLKFIQNQTRTHHHLDWRPISEWINDPGQMTLLAYQAQRLAGVVTFSPLREGTSWMRLVSLRNDMPDEVFYQLFAAGRALNDQRQARQIIVLEMETWLQALLEESGFLPFDHMVHLKRDASQPALRAKHNGLQIRPVRPHDLPVIELVDHAAFPSLWWMELADLQEALTYAVSFTMAVMEQRVVGYQLSTAYPDAIHLARLATWPSAQRRGIGTALIETLIARFPKKAITVNTQASNSTARRIYQRLGFERQKSPTPIWHLVLQPEPAESEVRP